MANSRLARRISAQLAGHHKALPSHLELKKTKNSREKYNLHKGVKPPEDEGRYKI